LTAAFEPGRKARRQTRESEEQGLDARDRVVPLDLFFRRARGLVDDQGRLVPPQRKLERFAPGITEPTDQALMRKAGEIAHRKKAEAIEPYDAIARQRKRFERKVL